MSAPDVEVFRKKTELLPDIFKLPAEELGILIDTVLTAIRRFNYPWNHSLFKSHNPTMRKMTKWEGGAELARKIYLGHSNLVRARRPRNLPRDLLQRAGNKESLVLATRWSENITAADMQRRYSAHFEVPTASHRSNIHRLQRRVAVVWPSFTDSARVGVLFWVERKIKNYYGEQAKKIFKKIRNNNCFWVRRGPCAPRLGSSHV
ncbi:uncharacterized protein K441DRAFT_669157 [Cenococcum geophilum 1.58]|uniref:Uncharacterized protein n=1 Tax=Cenococcum geophilum 1.58 TaxID=794803 RepID=A0ACC8EPZ0_9PEZI|nr:hypothetical protein K441DRAFT_669157 [Cenococcum geophilum 1.58]